MKSSEQLWCHFYNRLGRVSGKKSTRAAQNDYSSESRKASVASEIINHNYKKFKHPQVKHHLLEISLNFPVPTLRNSGT